MNTSELLETQRQFLRRAIEISRRQLEAHEGGPFGAIVVCDGAVVSQGWNRVIATNDPTAHAEVVAIRNACATLNSFSLAGCEIYCSCEPCPMCLAAIYWARLDRVFFAATQSDAAEAGFDDANFYRQLALPPLERAVPMTRGLRDEARAPLLAWLDKPDRVDY